MNQTKFVACQGPGCSGRRAHFARPDTPRNVRMIEVPQDFSGRAFCSIECACYAGAYSVKRPEPFALEAGSGVIS
jgi:hypothetical protein